MRPFHVMIKPAGALCNLRCEYCFYLHKQELLNSKKVISDELLEIFIRDYIASQNCDTIVFTWQGGEPTLAGLDFYKKAIALQKKYCPTKKFIENDFQTNGTLLTDEWYKFFKENNFLVGLSVDGPPHLHNIYRKFANGTGSASAVELCAKKLHEYKIPFNSLTTINSVNSNHAVEVYNYLKDVIKSQHMQFLPVVEVIEFEKYPPGYWDFAKLKKLSNIDQYLTPWSVNSLEYGNFLKEIFSEWVSKDLGKVFVYIFEALLGIHLGYESTMCVYSKNCGTAYALESDGTLYCCDRFCYPEYALGNIKKQNIKKLAISQKSQLFGNLKKAIPEECKDCEFLKYCNGGCPKNRFASTTSGKIGLNYLCEGWKTFLKSSIPILNEMAKSIPNSSKSK